MNSLKKNDQAAVRQLPDQFLGNYGTIWHSMTSALTGWTSAHNLFTARSGITAVNCNFTLYEAWKLFINERMLRHIVHCTLASVASDEGFLFTVQELEKFIALQYARGIYGKSQPVHFLYRKQYGPSLYSLKLCRGTNSYRS